MIPIARALVTIIGTFTALVGALALVLLAAAPEVSLQSVSHLVLATYVIVAALFSFYSFVYLIVGSEPRRQIQVLIATFAFLVLYGLIQLPEGRSFIRSIVH
jgi:hypothetical protein